MEVTKPHKFIEFGAMHVTKPYKFIRFGAMDAGGCLRNLQFSTNRAPKEPPKPTPQDPLHRRGYIAGKFSGPWARKSAHQTGPRPGPAPDLYYLGLGQFSRAFGWPGAPKEAKNNTYFVFLWPKGLARFSCILVGLLSRFIGGGEFRIPNCHEMALELVCGDDFCCNRHCRTSPVVLAGFGAKFGRKSAENRPKNQNFELPMNR